MHSSTRVALLFCCFLAFVSTAWPQGSVGTLNGTVLDQGGALVPGAAVIATNTTTGEEHRTTTTGAGAYTLPYMPAGTYVLRVSAQGFRTSEASNVVLHVAETLTVNITLQLGEVTQQITVSATTPLLESGTAEIGRYISLQEYNDWPTIVSSDGQRQIQDFIFSSLPGTTGTTFQGSINGGQNFSHEILIEGISLGRTEMMGGTSMEFSPSSDAISEFKLQTGAVSAQYNGGQTAVANFAIKSGTNDLHGSAFYYLQNEALNAEDTASKAEGLTKPIYRQNDFGYSVGGPVYIPKVYNGRNKTFWFTNIEHSHLQQLTSTGFATLPTQAFKNGDFSQLLNPAFTGNPLSGTQIGTDALGRPVIFGQIYDPRSTRLAPNGSIVRDPFPGNIIQNFDPVAANVISKAGITDPTYSTMLRNTPIDNCNGGLGRHSEGVKIDHNISERNHLSGYYNRSYLSSVNTPGLGPCWAPLPPAASPTSQWGEQIEPTQMVRLSLNSNLTPTILNRFAAGYNRFRNENGALPSFTGKDWAGKLGIQNTSANFFPGFTFTGNEYQGGTIPRLELTSVTITRAAVTFIRMT